MLLVDRNSLKKKKERSIQKYLESANSNLVKSLIESGEYESL